MEILVATPIKKMPERVVTGKFPVTTKKCGLLDEFVPQENLGKEKKQRAKGRVGLAAIKKAFSEQPEIVYLGEFRNTCYTSALDSIKNLKYFSKDVALFSACLVELQEIMSFSARAGFFLSALINNCPESDFSLHLGALSTPIRYLGHQNTKNITVFGSVGEYIGESMKGGSITVHGNVEHCAGSSMHGGKITIKGNAGSTLGTSMNGGTIIVEGDSGAVGACMKGGTILVKGKIGSISMIPPFGPTGGNIFEGKRQVLKDGKVVGAIQYS